MQWSDPSIMGDAFESRLCLTRREGEALKKAADILTRIQVELEVNYGGPDDALDTPVVSDWIYAAMWTSDVVSQIRASDAQIVLPVRRTK